MSTRPEPTGRERGVAGLARSWVAVMSSPRTFFRETVVPGDQAPGLVFALAVVLVEETTRLVLVPGAVPTTRVGPLLSGVLTVAIAVLLVAPVALHLVAAVLTLGLVLVAPERATISETVQVVGYASAPCLLAGVPLPAVRVMAAVYGGLLLGIGVAVVHEVRPGRAAMATLIPAVLVFGYGFRGIPALLALVPG